MDGFKGGLWIDPDLPGDPAAGFLQGSGHGAIFLHGKLTGFFSLIGVDGAFQGENDMDIFPEGWFFSFLPFAFDDHAEVFYGLPLFFEDRHDIDATAAAQPHQQHLHRADAEFPAACFGAAIHAGGMPIAVPGFEAEIPLYPCQFDACHIFKDIFLQSYGRYALILHPITELAP
jgi:hypothetical protein